MGYNPIDCISLIALGGCIIISTKPWRMFYEFHIHKIFILSLLIDNHSWNNVNDSHFLNPSWNYLKAPPRIDYKFFEIHGEKNHNFLNVLHDFNIFVSLQVVLTYTWPTFIHFFQLVEMIIRIRKWISSKYPRRKSLTVGNRAKVSSATHRRHGCSW